MRQHNVEFIDISKLNEFSSPRHLHGHCHRFLWERIVIGRSQHWHVHEAIRSNSHEHRPNFSYYILTLAFRSTNAEWCGGCGACIN